MHPCDVEVICHSSPRKQIRYCNLLRLSVCGHECTPVKLMSLYVFLDRLFVLFVDAYVDYLGQLF